MTNEPGNVNDPQRANAEGRQTEDQMSSEASGTTLPQQGDEVTQLYKREEDAGRAALAGWIHHEQVRPTIEAAREATETFVAPIAPYLTGQLAVTNLVCSVLLMQSSLPNGERNPFVLDPATGWPMPPQVRNMLLTDFRAWLAIVAHRLASAGVPLDADYPGDHLVIGQLLLLDCWAPGYDLVHDLNVAGPTMYNQHGTGTPFIRGRRTDRATLNASRVMEDFSRRARGERNIATAPYAATGPRVTAQAGRYKAARLQALREVVDKHPDFPLAKLLPKWGSAGREHPTYLYRASIARQLGISFDDAKNQKPSQRTLERDCDEIGVRFR